MNNFRASTLPALPLLLWDTPPGLELILAQEGVPTRRIIDPHPLGFQAGRFVLYDGRRDSAATIRARLSPDNIPLDIDALRRDELIDPFQALIDTRADLARWEISGIQVSERVARVPKAAIRQRLVDQLRKAISASGGVWMRLAAFPFPYQSAFNFRADLDENDVDDYSKYALARHNLSDCCTHFVSTHAYGEEPSVMQDLLRFDTQSHGHYHVIYRDQDANRQNLKRAHQIMCESGIAPTGFAAPHGRWNHGLNQVLEDLGYSYSSDFQLGYDDLPFFPWLGDRFSTVLQVPIHPICEGLFFDAGVTQGRVVADYLAAAVRAKIDAGEPAFVYGHPEGRLGRHPEILAALDAAISGDALLWRVTLTEFAAWWHWRSGRQWSVLPKADGRYEVQFEDWSADYPLCLDVLRGQHISTIPITGSRTTLRLDDLTYQRKELRADVPVPSVAPRPFSIRMAVRNALDWETVTPLDHLPANSLADRLKKQLRRWRNRRPKGLLRHEEPQL